jgi:hypothetical protein
MEIIYEIRKKLKQNQFEFSKHAVDNMIIRRITVKEVREAISRGEVIEDYPQDKYGPSCLVLGFTSENRPLHIHCSYPTRPQVKVVTVYEPDPNEWIDFKVRIT